MRLKTVILRNISFFLVSVILILSNSYAQSQTKKDSLRTKKNTALLFRPSTTVGNVSNFPLYKRTPYIYGEWGIGGGINILIDQEIVHLSASSTLKLKPGLMFYNTIGRPLTIPVFDPSNPEAIAIIGYERLNSLGLSLELCQNMNIKGVLYNISVGGDYHWYPSSINRPYPDSAIGAPIAENSNLYISLGVEPRLKRIASFSLFLRQARMKPRIINIGISTSILII